MARPTGLDCFFCSLRPSARRQNKVFEKRRSGRAWFIGRRGERSVIPTPTLEGVVAWPGHDVDDDEDWLQDQTPEARNA